MAKITIQCVNCNCDREIKFAHRKLIKRCKECQIEFNRDQARNRYRKKNGIPLDRPTIIPKPPKKKKKVEIVVVEVDEKPKIEQISPEEEERRRKAVERLVALTGSDTTVDDW